MLINKKIGKKELYILEVNESMHFKNFYFNIEDRYEKEEEDKDKDNIKTKETKTKTYFTSKTSNKKNGDDSSIVIHNIRNKKSNRKSAWFNGIQPDSDNKVIKILRKNKSGSLRLNLNNAEDE